MRPVMQTQPPLIEDGLQAHGQSREGAIRQLWLSQENPPQPHTPGSANSIQQVRRPQRKPLTGRQISWAESQEAWRQVEAHPNSTRYDSSRNSTRMRAGLTSPLSCTLWPSRTLWT